MKKSQSRTNELWWPFQASAFAAAVAAGASYEWPLLMKVDRSVPSLLLNFGAAGLAYLGIWLAILLVGTQRYKLEIFKRDKSFEFLLQDFKTAFAGCFALVLICILDTCYGYDGDAMNQIAFVSMWFGFIYCSSCIWRVSSTLWLLAMADFQSS